MKRLILTETDSLTEKEISTGPHMVVLYVVVWNIKPLHAQCDDFGVKGNN